MRWGLRWGLRWGWRWAGGEACGGACGGVGGGRVGSSTYGGKKGEKDEGIVISHGDESFWRSAPRFVPGAGAAGGGTVDLVAKT